MDFADGVLFGIQLTCGLAVIGLFACDVISERRKRRSQARAHERIVKMLGRLRETT